MYEFDTCDKFMSCGNSWATKDIGQVLTVIAVLTKTLCQSLDSNKSIDLVHNVLLAHFNNDNLIVIFISGRGPYLLLLVTVALN